ncbi:MAG: HIT domain-containing protein [Anaerolineae bacterium]
MSFLIPVQRLRETSTLMAFYHPRPSYLLHILIVPKRALSSLQALSPADADFMLDLFTTTQSLVAEFHLADKGKGYSLIANGGARQDVPQLHFHLVSGDYHAADL